MAMQTYWMTTLYIAVASHGSNVYLIVLATHMATSSCLMDPRFKDTGLPDIKADVKATWSP